MATKFLPSFLPDSILRGPGVLIRSLSKHGSLEFGDLVCGHLCARKDDIKMTYIYIYIDVAWLASHVELVQRDLQKKNNHVCIQHLIP